MRRGTSTLIVSEYLTTRLNCYSRDSYRDPAHRRYILSDRFLIDEIASENAPPSKEKGKSITKSRIQESADVDPSAQIGRGSTIWHLAQIREGATIGDFSSVGRGAYVGAGVVIGESCKIQNYAQIFEPASLDRGVFVGPGAVFTNDSHPRAVNYDGSSKKPADWNPVGVSVGEGASIGANATCVAPVTIGPWALVAAGAVVTQDVPAHALVAGVPARQIGWVGRAGKKLISTGDVFMCRETGETYRLLSGQLALVSSHDR